MRDVLAVDHAKGDLRDHVARRSTHKRRTEDFRLALPRQHLDEALGDPVTDGSVNLVVLSPINRVPNALLLQLLFSFAHSGDLRVGEGAPRQGNLVYIDAFEEQSIVNDSSRHDVRMVRELKLGATVASCIDILVGSTKMIVY